MFKKITEAYAILSNPNRRKKYDLYGETEDVGDDDEFMNMFGDMFSGMSFGGGFGGMEDDFEEFIKILEQDNVKSFKKMF